MLDSIADAIERFRTSLLLRRKGGRLSALLNLRVAVHRHGRRIIVPLVGGVGFDNLVISEPWMSRVLTVLLARKRAAFVDVGANIGQTLLTVKTLAPDIEYIGFEPNPVCFNYTRNLIALNHFEDCMLFPVGLSNATQVVSLFARHSADVSASTVEGFRPLERAPRLMPVAVHEGDALFESLGRPDVAVLKVDVEGGELEVMQGLHALIERSRPFILCEILPIYSPTSERGRFRAVRQQQLLALLREPGYVMFRILRDASPVRLDEIDCHDDMELTNYLFVPAEEQMPVESALAAGTGVAQNPQAGARHASAPTGGLRSSRLVAKLWHNT